jgi:hypothetical protein
MATKKKPASQPGPAREPAADISDSKYTVNGEPIPLHLEHLIPYEKTDQGMAELRERDKDKPKAFVEVLRDEHHKKLDAYEAQPWDGGDPLTTVVDKIREPGFDYKALSPRLIEKRGMRGFQIVPGAKFGNMPIGRMPTEVKERRNEHYRREAADALADASETYASNQEKLIRDGNVSGLAPLRAGEIVQDRAHPGRAASIGHTSSHGPGAEAA